MTADGDYQKYRDKQIAREQAEAAELGVIVHDLAAFWLSGKWKEERMDNGRWRLTEQPAQSLALVADDGHERVSLEIAREGQKLAISSDAPGLYKWLRYNEHFPVIHCAIDKRGAQIAGDIERRFLPEYREQVARCRKLEAQDQQDKADTAAAALALQAQAPTALQVAVGYEQIWKIRNIFRGPPYIDGDVLGPSMPGDREGRINLRFQGIPQSFALRVLAVVEEVYGLKEVEDAEDQAGSAGAGPEGD